ncbi:hypothetical protein D7Z26_23500 [Cohnella endophytica]|uniref:DUF4352 domain-containing protein n=1 Tax=Cohnella endophytica TaxID=2419778 RepID=A0A494XB72_9BACL|nr:hypothetical protein [Cohnella endophytica]RKP47272.1 hypothetical protein D7Z26_23500 [Cohnella endophytica]
MILKIKRVTTIMLMLCMALSFLSPASIHVNAANTRPSIDKQIIKLSAKSSLTLKDAQFLSQERGRVLSFTVTVTNNENKELNLIDYWIRVKDSANKSYSVNLITADKSKTKVAANSSLNLTYFGIVDSTAKISDYKFEIIKWDFSVSGYERKLGTIQYPASSTEKVQAFTAKAMLYDTTKVRSALKQYLVSQDDDKAFVTMNFLVENVGSKTTNLSKMKFFVQTENQMTYDVDTGDLSKVIIQPSERKIITLHSTIPIESAKKGINLTAAVADEANNVTIPLGVFIVPAKIGAQTSSAQKIGGAFSYNDYSIKLNNIQRTPSGNGDVLLAELQITNKSNTFKEIPNLSGVFTVNGVDMSASQTTSTILDQIALLGPGETSSTVIRTEIPFSTSIKEIVLAVAEKKTGEETAKTIYHFSDNHVNIIPSYNIDQTYVISNLGRRADVKLLRATYLEGDRYENIYFEVEYQNKENRPVSPAALAGYVQNQSQATIPVTFTEYKEKIMPTGKVLLTAWAKVPKTYTTDYVTFTIGQSISSPGTGEGTTALTSIAQPFAYKVVKNDQSTTKTMLKDIGVQNYVFSMNNVLASFNEVQVGNDYMTNGVKLTFDYDLQKLGDYENESNDHKILVEVVNLDSKMAQFSKEFSINDPVKADAEDNLKVGTKLSKSIVETTPEVFIKFESRVKYRVNVYHVYKDEKFLMATKEITWFYIDN